MLRLMGLAFLILLTLKIQHAPHCRKEAQGFTKTFCSHV
jgi:hypothetical protein